MMKTKLLIAALAFASAALVLSSCTREDIDDTLPKGAIRLIADDFQSNAKLGVDSEGAQLHFIAGDTLWINGDSYIVNATTNGTAYILDNNGALEGKAIYAVYPHSIVDATVFDAENPANVKIDLPAAYEYRCDGTSQIVRAPLAAYRQAGNTDALQFQHLTAAVTLKISNGNTNPIKLKSIILTNGGVTGNTIVAQCLAGTKNITISNNIAMDQVTNGNNAPGGTSSSISVSFGSGSNNSCTIDGNSSAYIQIPILPVKAIHNESNPFDVEIRAGLDLEGSIETFEYFFKKGQQNTTEITIAQGELAYIPVDMTIGSYSYNNLNWGMRVDGAFSISSTQKVYFAKGNLKYYVDGDDDPANPTNWAFFNSQDSILENDDEKWRKPTDGLVFHSGIGTSPNRWMSLFVYGTNGTNANLLPRSLPSNFSTSSTYGNLLMESLGNHDWGKRIGTNSRWFTLSKENWEYLLNNDRMNPGTSVNEAFVAYRYTTINGKAGLIIYPDNFWGTLSVQNILTAVPTNTEQLDATKWEALQKVGVVFLPAAGQIIHRTNIWNEKPKNGSIVTNVTEGRDNGTCFYWTSTYTTDNGGGPWFMQCSSAPMYEINAYGNNTQKAYALAVRLAHPANF